MANVTARCENPDCGKTFTASRSDAKFCSSRCRQAVHRRSKNPVVASKGRGGHRRDKTQVEMMSTLVMTLRQRNSSLGSSDLDISRASPIRTPPTISLTGTR
jgi:hypothetical protein